MGGSSLVKWVGVAAITKNITVGTFQSQKGEASESLGQGLWQQCFRKMCQKSHLGQANSSLSFISASKVLSIRP